MVLRHSSGTAHALYHTFVFPNLSQSSTTAIRRSTLTPSKKAVSHNASRPLSSTTARALPANDPRTPEVRKEKWNEEITSKVVYLIDPETNTLLPEPRTRYDLLRRIDLTTHRLVQFNAEHDGLPVCKIVNKRAEFERERRLKQASKERKKLEGPSKSVKTLELNWAMDPNDLGHRLGKVVEFLGEGRKVEVILASKKKGKKASPEECEDVLRKIRKAVDGVNGAKEAKDMEGKVGGFATLFFQGRTVQQLQQLAAG